MSALEDLVLVDHKELADLRAAKIALRAEQRKHAKARRRIAELEREIEQLKRSVKN
jgi:hypothetical protein